MPISAMNIMSYFLFPMVSIMRSFHVPVYLDFGFAVPSCFPLSLNSSASNDLFGTGRAWVDRWPDPQLSIWPIKLSKKA